MGYNTYVPAVGVLESGSYLVSFLLDIVDVMFLDDLIGLGVADVQLA